MASVYHHTCRKCDSAFESSHKNSLFCSKSCASSNPRPRVSPTPKVCPACGQVFTPKPASQFCCSRECGYRQRQGEKHYDYKGGYVNPQGYRVIKIGGRKVMEHQLVMEEHLGHPLPPHTHVHHIDGNKLNNDISNLSLLTPANHRKAHSVYFRTDTHKECRSCREVKPRSEFHRINNPRRDPSSRNCKPCQATIDAARWRNGLRNK